MPPREAPTARQRRLGTELRKMRERVGISSAEAADRVGVNRARISNIEVGRIGVTEERIRVFATIYDCGDEAYVDALVAMAAERGRGWWEEYRGKSGTGLLDLAELEWHATAMRSMQAMHMPGLLQTEDYIRALFSIAVPKLSAVQIRRSLSFRLKRRDVMDRDDPPLCTFLIHEAALRMEYGGPKVALGQLEHLLEASERDNVAIRVIPFSAGGIPNAVSSTLYASGPVPQLDTVQVDVVKDVAMLDAETHLANYRAALDRVEEASLSPEETRDFIRAIARQL
jgi:transcriptional regulator with XRE-family HTH domain